MVTGASGFLGQAILRYVEEHKPGTRLVAIRSPRDGGIDLREPGGYPEIPDVKEAALIHAAAKVDFDSVTSAADSVNMAFNVGIWASAIGIPFSVFVSSVAVFGDTFWAHANAPVVPTTAYGVGKWAAEKTWEIVLPVEQRCIFRMAGLWGWQQKPTLFWNRVLLAAVRGECLTIRAGKSRRNYISTRDAAALLVWIADHRLPGTLLGAGLEVVTMSRYVEAVQALPGACLEVKWERDDGENTQVFHPSGIFVERLHTFQEELSHLWDNPPAWI